MCDIQASLKGFLCHDIVEIDGDIENMDLSEEQFGSGTSSLSELVMSHEYRKNMPKVRFLHQCARNIRSISTSLPLQIDGFASVRSHRLPGFRV